MRRRQMLVAAGLVLAGVPLGSTSVDVPRRVHGGHAALIRAKIDEFRTLVYQKGAGQQVLQDITALLDYTTALVPHASDDRVKRHFLDALGDVAGLAAYAYRDRGDHDQAQEHYLLAVQSARAAGDAPLVGHLVVRMAGHQIELEQPDQVLHHLQAARLTGQVFTASELSNQCSIGAWAQAQMGKAQQVHRHIGLAEDYFADGLSRVATRPQQSWQVRHTAEAELFSLTGAAYSELAKHDPRYAAEAIRRLQLALTLRGGSFARNATLDRISLAEAYLAAHEVEQCIVVGTEALDHAEVSFSQRIRVRLSGLADSLVVHGKRSDVAETIDRIDTVRGAGSRRA